MNEDVAKGLPAEALAHSIYHPIEKKAPQVHYIKGKTLERLSILLKKILPSKCFERLLKEHYQL